MTEGYAKVDAKLDKLMKSIDLLFSKIENLNITQQQMQVKLDINSKVVDLSMREQQVMAQQLDATGKVVAKLTMGHVEMDDPEQGGSPTRSTATYNRQHLPRQDHQTFGEPHYHCYTPGGRPYGHVPIVHKNSMLKMQFP